MSVTSKSPKDVLRMAFEVAKNALAPYSHRCSPKKFTQYQLFAVLVLKAFLKTDYRGVCQHLKDCSGLAEAIELSIVPHFTTLQKASRRLLKAAAVKRLLDATIERHLGRRSTIQIAAVDSTGLECNAASGYFVKRRAKVGGVWKKMAYHRYPKLAVVCDVRDHFIFAYHAKRGPKPDVGEFETLIKQAATTVKIVRVVADAGYDSEGNHTYARETLGARSTIPPKHGRPTKKPASGKYRRLMQTHFNKKTYRQRAQVETVMSMLKRRQGNHVRGRSYHSQCRDLRLMVLTHNVMILYFG